MIRFETERLNLRMVHDSDLVHFIEMDTSENVMKYIGEVSTDEFVREYFPKLKDKYTSEDTYGVWMADLKDSGETIGWFMLKPLPEDEGDDIELGYRLREKFWGKGYATEGAKVVLDHAFNEGGLNQVVGVTHPEHKASQNVLKKIGMAFEKDSKYTNSRTGEISEVRLYSVHKS